MVDETGSSPSGGILLSASFTLSKPMTESSNISYQLAQLIQRVDQFTLERDWSQFHTPKNLAMALTVEAAELLELFQWEDGAAGMENFTVAKRESVGDEVADIFIYLLRFCSVTGLDILNVADKKLKLNAIKYPVGLSKGSSKKYDELK